MRSRQYKNNKPLLYVLYQTNSYFVLVLYILYPTFLWQKIIKQNHRAIKISKQHKENRIYQNRKVCSNLTFSETSGTPKILKKQDDLRNLYINILQKESGQKHFLIKKIRIIFVSAKFLSFQQDQTTITQEDPIGSTWHKH